MDRQKTFRILALRLSKYSEKTCKKYNVSGLAKMTIFTTNLAAENHFLIDYKCVC